MRDEASPALAARGLWPSLGAGLPVEVDLCVRRGAVRQVSGLRVEVTGLRAGVGERCTLLVGGRTPALAEVVGFQGGSALVMPIESTHGLAAGDPVLARGEVPVVPVGARVLGRILDGLGRPIDGLGPLGCGPVLPLDQEAPNALDRTPIALPFATGVRAIDGLLTLGRGQRVGIFAGSGVGKSTLLGKIARDSCAEVAVIALVGERGREVREFIEVSLGPDGLRKSVVVVATSDRPAVERVHAAHVAVSIAEHFRRAGGDVLLLMDSVTRYAIAVRELGLAAGEPPTTKGYPPSLYVRLPKLVERLGTSAHGTITGLLTVLVEGDDLDDPVADSLRSLLDGHIVLGRHLAEQGHFPAIDVLKSVSRTLDLVTSDEHRARIREARRLLATYREARDLIDIGAYRAGSNPEIDRAVRLRPQLRAFLCQEKNEASTLSATREALGALLGANGGARP